MFCGILLTTSFLQIIIVEFGSVAFSVAKGGLSAQFWGLSLIFGFGAFPVQQIINVLYKLVFGNDDIHVASSPSANGP